MIFAKNIDGLMVFIEMWEVFIENREVRKTQKDTRPITCIMTRDGQSTWDKSHCLIQCSFYHSFSLSVHHQLEGYVLISFKCFPLTLFNYPLSIVLYTIFYVLFCRSIIKLLVGKPKVPMCKYKYNTFQPV